jgi:hypothetical protein
MLFSLAQLAISPALFGAGALELSDAGGVKMSCLENVRGKTGRARIEIVVGTGALDESEAERGLAHLVEHVLLRPLGFDDSNGETSRDYTRFWRDVRAAELSTTAIDLVRAIEHVPSAQKEFELEREAVLRELEERHEALLLAADPIFGGTILSRPVGGTPDSVRDLTLESIRRFHARNYVKKNVAVFIRGAVRCEDVRLALTPLLAALPDGERTEVPKVDVAEPGARSLGQGYSAGVFQRGYYWYRSTIEDELLMMIVAKHLEQRALLDLRKEQGITYSPRATFSRLAGGGMISLEVRTSGQDRLVEKWWDSTLHELVSSETPRTVLKSAIAVVADSVDSELVVRTGLAAIRGEPLPEAALASLSDSEIHARVERFLSKERSFGTTSPARNWLSLVVLAGFGALVLGVISYAGLKMMRGR